MILWSMWEAISTCLFLCFLFLVSWYVGVNITKSTTCFLLISQPVLTLSKSGLATENNVWNVLKVNNKDKERRH